MPHAAASRAHSSGTPRDQIQFSVAFQIVLVARLWRARFLERAKAQGQTDARWTALYMIADEKRGITQADLAERLGVRGPTLVRLVEAMEKQGLVSRVAAPNDRRAKIISIRPKGQEVLAGIDTTAAQMRDELFSGVSDKDLETVQKALRTLAERLDPQRAPRVAKRR